MSMLKSDQTRDSVHLRHFSPPASVLSDDFDRLLSDDENGSESSIELDFSQTNSRRNLPPVDGGRRAWTFLAACWLLEAMMWGFPLAFGVFQSYYSNHSLFLDNKNIPSIGTLATGVSYLGMPFTNAIVLRWPQYQRLMCFAGWLMCLVGLVGASFATTVWQLLLFQGLLYGTGWVVCYTPFLFMLNGWFVEKRGLAYGILFGASGVSGLIIPLAMGALLNRFDFRVALRVYVVVAVIISGPGLLLIKPRIPVSPGAAAPEMYAAPNVRDGQDSIRRVVQGAPFVLFATAIFAQGLAFFLPNIFLPSYAASLSISETKANSLLALTSLAQVTGQIFMGYISDIWKPHYPASLSALCSAIAAVFLWGAAKGMGMLVPFSMFWGFWSASYSVLYTGMCSFLTPDHGVGMTVYGIFSFERGVANILEGPIGGWLLRGDEDMDVTEFGLGQYSGVVWFTAMCMLTSSLLGISGLLVQRK